MIDAIGTLRLVLPGKPGDAARGRAAAAAALPALGPQQPGAAAVSERVLLIRRLQLELRVGAEGTLDQLAAAAGRELEGELHRTIARPLRQSEVITFASTAEYLAHFVEQAARQRPVDVWYFRPLREWMADDFAETLRNIGEREPVAWPAALALLRQRGLTALLLQRLSPADYEILYGVTRGRQLERAEAAPLFKAAMDIAVRAVPGIAQPAIAIDQGQELTRFLQGGRNAPQSWADPGAIAQTVAEMLRWLIDRHADGRIDVSTAERAIREYDWLDAGPLLQVVRAASGVRPVSRITHEHMPGEPRMNRTRALRYLSAARRIAEANTNAMSVATGVNEALTVVEQVVAVLARTPVSRADRIERLLLGPDHAPGSDARSEALLARLRAAAQQLSRAEARQLAEHIHAACNSVGVDLTTSAAGLFLLIRPLLDLRIPSAMGAAGLDPAAARAFLSGIGEAAGIASDDAGLAVFASGDNAAPERVCIDDAQRGALLQILRTNAERLGLNVKFAESTSPQRFVLELACQQLVRWLHGFEKSSHEFVLRTLVHNHGTLMLGAGEPVTVAWPGSALDLLLDRVGFLDPLALVPWWNGRGLVWLR
ncbi:MAG: hypothetical protein WEE89_14635 [Gemmatimonadota bacterium]